MKIILKTTVYYLILNFICICFKIHKILETNKTNLFFFDQKNRANKYHNTRSVIYNSNINNNKTIINNNNNYNNSCSDNCSSTYTTTYTQNEEHEAELRKKIEQETEQKAKIKKENNLFINANFKYVSNNIPINVEKKYTYDSFKYSDDILAYIFHILNLFKHEQFKNKIYKQFIHNEVSNNGTNSIPFQNNDFLFNKNNTLVERNKEIIKNFIHKFGEKFTYFNTYEKVQREDWANMIKIEQEDKSNFFKNLKIKNEKTKEYYFVIYYCNWKYECMALYNAVHNIFHNSYNNVNFYNISNNIDVQNAQQSDDQNLLKKKKTEQDELISTSDIEKIKDMYIKDMQNNDITDIDSLLNQEANILSGDQPNQTVPLEQNENQKIDQYDQIEQNKNNITNQSNGKELSGKELSGQELSSDAENKENKKKSFQEIIEEEKKKLDEEFFLYGYSKYEDAEEIKKEEDMIKETKKIINEEKLNKNNLNNEKDFKNILNDFPLIIKHYKDFYKCDNIGYDENKTNLLKNSDVDVTINDQGKNQINDQVVRSDNNNSIFQTMQEIKEKNEKKEVNINVIFVKLSNSTVIGKTKNIKKKIKKKWIYSHEKEIKYYELILSVMLNENIYYKDIPHMDIFSVIYDKKKIYNFFNQINTNLKHSFIHKNNVYDIFNNYINDEMDPYNFDIYDKTDKTDNTNKDTGLTIYPNKIDTVATDNQIYERSSKTKKQNNNNKLENEDVILEELSLDQEIEDIENYQTLHDGTVENSDINNNVSDGNTIYGNINNDHINTTNIPYNNKLKIKKKKKNIKTKVAKKKHNKKPKSNYEVLFNQKYTNILLNNMKKNILINKITSISNVHDYANYTIDNFKDFPLSNILKKKLNHDHFKIDQNYIYYLHYKIPIDIFPFIFQLSLAYKYEHTTLLINAPKKIEFKFRNP
ncbi:conserved protein, unknown function [Hepatocystis sp. ex Piliocolobus tephrosceles]|nr:conserved protein, unknown function [Hepatocystis sp. ex Piliocolobus tephrosceles]